MADWNKLGSRGNVTDRRAFAPAAGGLGVTGVILYLLFSYFTGGQVDVGGALSQLQNANVVENQNIDTSAFEGADDYEVFVSTVLGSADDMWIDLFNDMGRSYVSPDLILFRTATESACGGAYSEVGPHYCPLDNTIYLDETFFDELQRRFGAQGGDVAQAYVIAHEVAHHAQNELGIMDEVNRAKENNPGDANDLSVKLELQADCFAGLWAYSIRDLGVLEPGEIQEAIDAAAAVGDDHIQKTLGGRVNPETWTHGSSADRVGWFNRGYESGQLSSCDTFNQ